MVYRQVVHSQGDSELCYADIAELSRQLRERELSSVDLTQSLLDRIEWLDPSLHAYATVLLEEALSDARRADAELARGQWRGRLHGVPIAIKDLCFTSGGVWQLLQCGGGCGARVHVPRS